MEVHHPHHPTHKKRWSEYLLEFLMLFLAVFLGFIAENIREGYIEHKRAHEFGHRLITDLTKDTAWFQNENRRLLRQKPNLDTLITILIQSSLPSNKDVLQKLININYVSDAKLNTATYNQMKSSGTLRYMEDAELTIALQEYYEIHIPRAIESSNASREFFNGYIKPFFIDHLRNQDMGINADSAGSWNPVISGRSRLTDQRLSNIVSMDKTQLNIAARFYESANQKASELIALLHKYYP